MSGAWWCWGTALVALLLAALVSWRRPPPQMWPYLLWFYVAVAVRSVGEAMTAFHATADSYWTWVAVLYTGSIFQVPITWLLVLGFTDWVGLRPRWAGPRVRFIPVWLAVGFWVVMLTNPWHGRYLVARHQDLNIYLPLWHVFFWFTILLALAVLALLCRVAWRTRGTHHALNALTLFAALLLPMIVNVLYALRILVTWPDPTVPAMGLSALLIGFGIYRGRLFALGGITPQRLLEAAEQAVITLDRAQHVHYANPAAVELLGADQVRPGTPVLDMLAPRVTQSDAPDARFTPDTLTTHLLDPPPTPEGHLLRIAHPTCEWVRMVLAPVAGRRGAPEGYSLRIIDVTAHERAHRASTEREREAHQETVARRERQRLESLGLMAGGVAHDFNNLLMGILGRTELLLMDTDADSPAGEQLRGIRDAAERAATLTTQLLAYAGKHQITAEPVDLTQLVQQMRNLLHSAVPHTVHQGYALAAVPDITGDAAQLYQVISALCLNAAEALADREGTVTVSTGTCELTGADLTELIAGEEITPGPHVYVEVSDTGCGMDPDTLERIFDPFFSTKFAGRGLGLAAVHGIVRAHHGALRVTSTPGAGSAFTAYFPVATDAQPETILAPASRATWRGAGTILVVDDEREVRAVATSFLTRLGFSVLTASDGREGIIRFNERAESIVAVLLDFTMPHATGDEVHAALRRLRPDVPIIIMSGYAAADMPAMMAADDRTLFLRKPFRSQALTDALRPLLEC